MKPIVLSALLVLSPTLYADWSYVATPDNTGHSAISKADVIDGTPTGIVIQADTDINKCNTIVLSVTSLSVPDNDPKERAGPVQIPFALYIDGERVGRWSELHLFVTPKGPKASDLSLSVQLSAEETLALARGSSLRINVDDKPYAYTNLRGSYSAIQKAFTECLSHLDQKRPLLSF